MAGEVLVRRRGWRHERPSDARAQWEAARREAQRRPFTRARMPASDVGRRAPCFCRRIGPLRGQRPILSVGVAEVRSGFLFCPTSPAAGHFPCVRSRTCSRRSTTRSALGKTERVSWDTNEIFAEYAGRKLPVKVSHSRQPAPPRPSVLTGHHAIAERARRAQASSSPEPCGTHGRSASDEAGCARHAHRTTR